jgi:hypothetical protein
LLPLHRKDANQKVNRIRANIRHAEILIKRVTFGVDNHPTGPGPEAWAATITRALTDEQADRYRPWFDNTRRLRDLVEQLKQLALEQAATDDQWPTS